jgi:hypothetical protein
LLQGHGEDRVTAVVYVLADDVYSGKSGSSDESNNGPKH